MTILPNCMIVQKNDPNTSAHISSFLSFLDCNKFSLFLCAMSKFTIVELLVNQIKVFQAVLCNGWPVFLTHSALSMYIYTDQDISICTY